MSKYIILLPIAMVLACSKPTKEDIKGQPLFRLLDSDYTNVDFKNSVAEDLSNFFGVFNYAYNGGGVAIGDINNDGLPDLYFTGNQVNDQLYINKGELTFENITRKAGIEYRTSWHNGVVMTDVNGDGFLDIYICKGGWDDARAKRKNLLYVNQGDNTFLEKSASYGLDDAGVSVMASFFDADNDNDLDMYLINRPKDFFIPVEQYKLMRNAGPDDFRDKLYINEGGIFSEKSMESGISGNLGYGLGLATSDINNDGYVDVFVANDYYDNDYLYINKGNASFKEEIRERTNHCAFYGMGVDVVDINNDGLQDIVELDMSPEDHVRSKVTMVPMNLDRYNTYLDEGFHNQYMHNMLYLNRGDGVFSEISQLAGISTTDWSWSCLGADFDNDGRKDIFVTNGFKRDIGNRDVIEKNDRDIATGLYRNKSKSQIVEGLANSFPSNKLSNYIFKNMGGFRFQNSATSWGLDEPSFSNGAAFGDLDNDGDLDLVVNNIDDKAFVYENTSDRRSNNYLTIRLRGPKDNINGLGARVKIFHGDSIQYQELRTVRGYLSSVEPIIHFGLGSLKKVDSVLVIWNDKKEQLLKQVTANQGITIEYSAAVKNLVKRSAKRKPLISENNEVFKSSIVHLENEFDDYKEQVLLPHKLSCSGPALAVGDINGDKFEDFYFGGGKDQPSRIYVQTSNGQFREKKQIAFVKDKMHEDVYAHFFDADNDRDLDIYVVSGGNELEENNEYYQDRLYINDGRGNYKRSSGIPAINTSGACVLSMDFDKDGDLDLFVGSRHVPHKYPSAPSSFILENEKGKFTNVTDEISPGFKNLGMVTSAVCSDIDNDDLDELLIVGEWMNISVFKWKDGRYRDISKGIGLDSTYGWWNHIEANDIDDDGDVDFVLGNLGNNYKFKASKQKPFYAFAGDYDKNGTQDVFLAKQYKNRLVPIRGKDCSTEQLPGIKEKFPTFNGFANAEIFDIIGQNRKETQEYRAELFESVLLVNNKGKFEIKELPVEAQFSVINGVVIRDLNRDGIKDMIVAGNRFNVEIETTRSDASLGLVMLGTEAGGFRPMSYMESGFFARGNVKGIEYIRQANGNDAFLVATNNDALKFFALESE